MVAGVRFLFLLALLGSLTFAPAVEARGNRLATGLHDLPRPGVAATYDNCFVGYCVTVEWCYIANRSGGLKCEPRPRWPRVRRAF